MRHLPLGVFDSGVGGLTVAAALRRRLPGESLLYLGDTARLPYGTKSPETVRHCALNAVHFLVQQGIKLLVVACNTASAHALTVLRKTYPDLPILGVVGAGARVAAQTSPSGRILVAATEGTCASGAFVRAITAQRTEAQVTQIPCPMFVALAEEGLADHPLADTTVAHYLAPRFATADAPDTLVLGCTHFPLLVPSLRRCLPPALRFVDCAVSVAEEVAQTLAQQGLASPPHQHGTTRFLVTDGPDRFDRIARHFFPHDDTLPPAQQVDLF